MSWLKKLFDSTPAAAVAPPPQPHGQMQMSLEERMGFRRKMAVEAVRSVLAAHGLPSAGYRLGVTPVDARGHRFAVMLELKPLSDLRTIDSWGEWQSMEAEIIQTAAQRYRVGVDGVYWRMNQMLTGATRSHGGEHVPDSEWAGLPVAHPPTPSAPLGPSSYPPSAPQVQPQPTLAAAAAKSVAVGAGFLPQPSASPVPTRVAGANLKKSSPASDDGFPDTLLEARPDDFEGVTPEELLAFEEAIRQGRSPQQPVKVGHRSYQTDYMPLG